MASKPKSPDSKEAIIKAVSFLKAKASSIICVALLIVSAVYLPYEAVKVYIAITMWLDLKHQHAGSGLIDDALHVVNDAETRAIPAILVTVVSVIAAVRIVDFRLIPRQCSKCGRWMDAREAKQSPDKLFYYHEKCDLSSKPPVRQ